MKKINPEKELKKIENGNRNKILYGIIALLLIVAVGSTYALYQVRHTQKLVFNTVGEFKKRDIYLSVLVDGEYQNDFPTKSEDMLYGGYECDGDAKINFDIDRWQVALYASHPDKCTIKFGHKYVDQSGANYPELYQGMIPVYFENGKIYVADITSEWYNYDDNKWANAVLIDYENKKDKFYDDNGNLLGGHEVSEEDIFQMYVWIPRYKYQLWNVNNETSDPQMINIAFEKDTSNTGDITCTYNNLENGVIEEKCVDKEKNPVENGDWYTHPAFTFGNTELKGFWVGKFEPSDLNDPTGFNFNEAGEIAIIPNKICMVNKDVKTQFNAVRDIDLKNAMKYNLDSNKIDTHMMKNMEWGATAYLSNSKYGIYNSDGQTCTIYGCVVYVNNTNHGDNTHMGSITGCAGDSPSANAIYNVSSCPGYEWNTDNGVKASTTGNIYGIYDMAGGEWDVVMSTILDDNGVISTKNSGFTAENFDINSRYYELYSYSDNQLTHERGYLGDATRETMKVLNCSYCAWNGDRSDFSFDGLPWLERGGYPGGTASGIFTFARDNGRALGWTTVRVVLTAQDGKE